ncbi:MAG: 3-deoxy-D-manno-octulosonic acid transferase [Pirellulales bacterium]|nr:3-deoxy-D-manno-octulosonic acid transferase [Pirellulales bacterium]
MPYLLNFFYLLLIVVATPWLIFQAIAKGKYREGLAAKFLGSGPQRTSNRPCIWLHAVSVGEVNLLGVMLKEVARQRPDTECVISTTTMTGFALAKQKYSQYTVFYCPLDFTWAARRAMRRIRPDLLLLAELELWPNLVRAAKRQGARVAIFNGRLSENSFRGYRRIRWLLQRVLKQVDVIAVQNEEYAERFIAIGAAREKVHTTGSLKFDGAQVDRLNPKTQQLAKLASIALDDIVFLAGSTQEPEERLALDAFAALAAKHPRLKLIVVPRHPHRFDEVAALLNRSGLPWQRRSSLDKSQESGTGKQNLPLCRILLIDTVGELGAWWGAATIGFVGGSLFSSRGGQNMIEPAAYGAAVSFGPNTQNFRDVVAMLLGANAAVRVKSGDELTGFIECCLEEPDYARRLGERAKAIVQAQQGATHRTWNLIEPLLATDKTEPQAQRNAA